VVAATVLTLAYAAACWLTGLGILRLFEAGPADPAVPASGHHAIRFLFGIGVLAAVWEGLGLVSLFTPAVITATLVVAAAHGLLWVYADRHRSAGPTKKAASFTRLPPGWALLALGVMAALAGAALRALIYSPAGDAEAFYMVLPKIMGSAARLMPQPNYVPQWTNYYEFSEIGLLGEMHFAAMFAFQSPMAAKLLVPAVGVAALVLILAFCEKCGLDYRGKIVAAVIVCSSTAFMNVLWVGKVDVFGAALGLAAYWFAFDATSRNDTRAFLLAGLFAGFAVVAKLSNLPVLGTGILLLLVSQGIRRSAPWPTIVRHGLVLGSGACLALFPHFLKNLVLFKEPFAPFLFLHGEGTHWADQAWFNAANTRYLLLTYPIALAYGEYPLQGGTMSPLILALVPVGSVIARSREATSFVVSRLGLVGGIGILTWMSVRPAVISPRYILATLLLFAPVGGWGAETILRRASNSLMLKGVMFLALSYAVVAPNLDHAYFFDTLRAGGYGTGNCVMSASCRGLEHLNAVAGEGERVYFLGYYAYHLRPDLLQCLNSRDDVVSDWTSLIDRGFRYVVLQKASHATTAPWLSADRAPGWLNVRVLYDDESTRVFAQTVTDDDHRATVKCTHQPAPAWSVVPSR
jgi:hypothetical protein